MQEGASIVGSKLAMITKDKSFIPCSRCKCNNETLDHILTNCSGRRQDYIIRHDIIGKQVYKAIGRKYGLFEHFINEPVTIKNQNVELYWNRRMAKGKNTQPDITLYDYKNQSIILFDISIVKMKYLKTSFNLKREKYNKLGLNLKNFKNSETNEIVFQKYEIIPIIITNEGLIHRRTIELFKTVNIKVEWGKAISKLLFHNVQLIQRVYTKRGKWRKRGREFINNQAIPD